MTGPDPCAALPAGPLLRRVAGEIDDMAALLRGLEEAVCDVLARCPSAGEARAAQLQGFDLLAQRLAGVSACLGAVSGLLDEGKGLPLPPLLAVLSLGAQRAALLEGRGPPARPARSSLELF